MNLSLRITVSTVTLLALIPTPFLVTSSLGAQTKDQAKLQARNSTQQARLSQRRAHGRRPQIARIVQEIDARNIEHAIRKLVSFGTRNTLSPQDDPYRGIGAARDWLYSVFLKAAEKSAGRMT